VLPATKAVPKEMLPLADKPAIQYCGRSRRLGVEHIAIVTSRSKRAIEDHFDVSPGVARAAALGRSRAPDELAASREWPD
jgi:UTP--glucose-1-phosphate uridylyltransferase